MKKSVRISENEKWQAVVSCDKNYDGLFFYGVKTTGIFCRPSCRAKTPVRTNAVFFDHAAEAAEAGFRPCKKCRPDQAVFEPDLELVGKAGDIFSANYDKAIELSQISRQLGISTSHLTRLFKQYSGLTPAQYIVKLRVEKASGLLGQTDMNILEIAYTAGFRSLSNFYKCFRQLTGHAPNRYRKSGGNL